MTELILIFTALVVSFISLVVSFITGIDGLRSNIRIYRPSVRRKVNRHYEKNRKPYLCANSVTADDERMRSGYHCFNIAKWIFKENENARAYCNRCVVKHLSDRNLL